MRCSFQDMATASAACACAVVAGVVLLLLTWVAMARGARRPHSVVLVVAASALSGALSASLCSMRLSAMEGRLSHDAVSRWRLEVTGDPVPGAYGYRMRCRMVGEGGLSGEVWVTADAAIERGRHIRCVGRFSRLRDDDYGRSGWAQGVCGSVRLVSMLEERGPQGVTGALTLLRDAVRSSIDPQAGEGRAVLAGCVLGYRTTLDEQGLSDVFAACGMAHVVAVSGAHLSVLVMLIATVLERTGLGVAPRLGVMVLSTGSFVLLCGAPASAVRAWAMAVAAGGSQVAGRRAHALSSVSLAALGMALTDPAVSGQLGYVLSVSSVAGLCLLSPYADYALRSLAPRPALPRGLAHGLRGLVPGSSAALRQVLGATVVCQMVTMPLTASVFGRISLVAPLANLVLSPLLGSLLPLGFLYGTTFWVPGLSDALLRLCDLNATVVVAVLRALSRIPYASIPAHALGAHAPLACAIVPVAILVLWPPVSRRACHTALLGALGLAVALHVRVRYLAPPRVAILDVGQGDAVLVQDGPAAVLVDTGPDGAVVDALARAHVAHLDAVVLTHLHDDHCGGLDDLVGMVPCDRVMVAHGVAGAMGGGLLHACDELTSAGPTELGYGDVLEVGGFDLRVVWPRDTVAGDENHDSLVLAVTYQQGARRLSALLAGDAEREVAQACVDRGDVGDVDLIKVGHHGSEVSLTPALAATLEAEVAVASAGEGNPYGHPRRECVEMLEGAGSLFLCTRDVGDVEVRPGVDGPSVDTQRQGLAEGAYPELPGAPS